MEIPPIQIPPLKILSLPLTPNTRLSKLGPFRKCHCKMKVLVSHFPLKDLNKPTHTHTHRKEEEREKGRKKEEWEGRKTREGICIPKLNQQQ